MKQLHILIHGQVQGIGFRWNTRQQAKQLRLVGWVRNNENGTVEVVAVGPEESLKKLLAWCAEGPRLADVKEIKEEWTELSEIIFNDFEIRY